MKLLEHFIRRPNEYCLEGKKKLLSYTSIALRRLTQIHSEFE